MEVKELKETEMLSISGGTLSSSIINSIANAINTIFELGKETGSSIRRLTTNQYCKVN